jgi:hypothetical protein
MSRPQKIHKPIKARFNQILAAVATGQGKGKATVNRLLAQKKKTKKPQRNKPK